jgi:hypothetical protein
MRRREVESQAGERMERTRSTARWTTRCALSLLLIGCYSASAWAIPEWPRLSIVGDAATTIGIAWNTRTGPAEAVVEYGLQGAALGNQAQGQVGTTKIDDPMGTVSEVTLTGLQPNTSYSYRVGGPQGGFSQTYTFKTGPVDHPECGHLSFVYVGDSRAEAWEESKGVSQKWPTMAKTMRATQPGFLLHGGDFVYNGSKAIQWKGLFGATADVMAELPIQWGIGNHDNGPGEGEGANYNRLLHLPRSDQALGGSGTEDFYAFTYGNAIFVSLSTEGFKGGAIKFQEQADWMDKILTQNPKRWKIVYMHKPIYTEYFFVTHKPNEEGQNAAFVPVINKHHVDLVIGSHNHFYERYAPSNCSDGGSDKPCLVADYSQGSVYITSGGGGAFPVFVPGLTNNVRLVASGLHQFLHFEIKDHQLVAKALDEGSNVIDTFTINKPPTSPTPCASVGPTNDAGTIPPNDGGSAGDSGMALADGVGPRTSPDGGAPRANDQGSTTSDQRQPATDASVAPLPSSGCGCELAAETSTTGRGGVLLLPLLLALAYRRAPRCRAEVGR